MDCTSRGTSTGAGVETAAGATASTDTDIIIISVVVAPVVTGGEEADVNVEEFY